ncbi:MAG: response regulator [Acidobacteriota bacterium]|jgi:CheY-like chemotaxis protein
MLVVDDNPVNQQISRAFLQKLGFQVEIASNGSEGVEMWERGDYLAIFMDCQMPVLDGLAATQQIRKKEQSLPQPNHLPIIALTASATPDSRQKCLEAGMDEYLIKPIARELMAQVLRRCLEKHSSPSATD